MYKKQKEIDGLEEENAELSKEILLNEVAIEETNRAIQNVDYAVFEHEVFQSYLNRMNLLISKIEFKNAKHQQKIVNNNIEIKILKSYG